MSTTQENQRQSPPHAPQENALQAVSEGLRLLTIFADSQISIFDGFGRKITYLNNRLEEAPAKSRPSVERNLSESVFLLSKAMDFTASRLGFELKDVKPALVLLEENGPFLSDYMDFSGAASRSDINNIIEQSEATGRSLDELIERIQELSAPTREKAISLENVRTYGANFTDSSVRFNNVLADMMTIYNRKWFAFKDIVDGLRVSMNEETFAKPDLASLTADLEDLTEEELEALEDAEDLAIAKERYATMDRSQLVPAGTICSLKREVVG